MIDKIFDKKANKSNRINPKAHTQNVSALSVKKLNHKSDVSPYKTEINST